MKTLEELKKIRDEARKNINVRNNNPNDIKVLIGMATCGIAAGARQVMKEFINQVDKKNIRNVTITQTDCAGSCEYEPRVEIIFPGNEKATYVNITPEKVSRIIDEHIINGNIVKEYTIGWNN